MLRKGFVALVDHETRGWEGTHPPKHVPRLSDTLV